MIIAEVGVVPAKKLGGEFEYTNNWSILYDTILVIEYINFNPLVQLKGEKHDYHITQSFTTLNSALI